MASMAGSSLSRGRFDAFIVNSNEAIVMKLIANENDLKEESNTGMQFNPEFSHQFFGDNETIFGYKQLRIKLYYSSARLECYLGMNYSEKITKEETEGIEADNVLKTIADKLEVQFCHNLDDFCGSLSKETSFKPYGQLVNSFSIDDKISNNSNKRYFEIFKADLSVPGFGAYHQRMQTFLLWFIDAASYIDAEDDRWQFFVVFEKQYHNPKTSLSNGHSANSESYNYCFVGYATIYRYYAYPQKTRPRISQFLILPPFQKRGLGVKLLQTIYDSYKTDTNVIDITVEDPSDNFTRIRDFVDCKNCSELKSFGTNSLKLGWSEVMANEAQTLLKISRRQARRVYEILRFRITDRSNDEEYKAYRIIVKQRLNAPNQKQLIDYSKLEKSGKLSETELTHIKQTTMVPNDIRLDQLGKQYRDLEDEYQHIIERLASS